MGLLRGVILNFESFSKCQHSTVKSKFIRFQILNDTFTIKMEKNYVYVKTFMYVDDDYV